MQDSIKGDLPVWSQKDPSEWMSIFAAPVLAEIEIHARHTFHITRENLHGVD
jgi:hypothetical protein